MEQTTVRRINVRYITELGLFVGVILLMKLTGLSSIPIGPLVMTFTMIPIAIGAMLLGPLAGTILGTFYGFLSLYDAITGKSIMTGIFFQYSPFLTILLCVGTRALVGFCTGALFKLLQKLDKHRIWSYFAGGLVAPLLNTFFFMTFIVLAFYQTDYVQNRTFALTGGQAEPFVLQNGIWDFQEAYAQWIPTLKGSVRAHVQSLGIKGPLLFIVLTVGFQGLIEAATGLAVGGGVAKGVAAALKRYAPIPLFKEVKAAAEKPDEAEQSAENEANETAEAPKEPEPTDEPKEE